MEETEQCYQLVLIESFVARTMYHLTRITCPTAEYRMVGGYTIKTAMIWKYDFIVSYIMSILLHNANNLLRFLSTFVFFIIGSVIVTNLKYTEDIFKELNSILFKLGNTLLK